MLLLFLWHHYCCSFQCSPPFSQHNYFFLLDATFALAPILAPILCSYFYSSLMFLLLLVMQLLFLLFHVPLFSPLMQLLLLTMQLLFLLFQVLFYTPSMLSLLLLFQIGVFPLSCFCMHGRKNKLSHSTFVLLQTSSSQTWRWVCWWLLFFVLIVHIFLSNFGWHVFFVVCKNYFDIMHVILHITLQFYKLHFILHICILFFFKTLFFC